MSQEKKGNGWDESEIIGNSIVFLTVFARELSKMCKKLFEKMSLTEEQL